MGGFRAKDADRERYVDVIEAAYVDGQLGEQDRELRVSRALTAETLDELDALTRDLQNRPVTAPPVAGRSEPARPAASTLARVASGGVATVVAVAAAVIFGIVGLAMFSASSDSGSELGTVEISNEAVPVPVDEGVVDSPSFAMTVPQVRRLVRAYEREFGTREAYEVGLYPGRVGVKVPVRGSRPRYERWTWTGGWTQDTQAAGVVDGSRVVDLGSLDVPRLFANIATAKRTLGVERGRLTHVLFRRWDGEEPSVMIYIGNAYGESGYLRTTPSGEVVRAYLFTA